MFYVEKKRRFPGSDRATILRYLEFLRFLVRSGELEL